MNKIIDKTLFYYLQRKTKRSTGGWISTNAVCCHHRGHRPDRRMRGGLIYSDDKLSYSCFNCQFKCGYSVGKLFSSNFKLFLNWIGMDEKEIQQLAFDAMKSRDTSLLINNSISNEVNFKEYNLPPDAIRLNKHDESHYKYIEFLSNRGFSCDDYPFYITPNSILREKDRIIIPYYYDKKLVGYTSRYCDNRKPKYISEQQSGYVFNIDEQDPSWQICIVVEGQFDALAIGGCAIMSNNVSEKQSWVLKKLKRKIIYVPDRDLAGMEGIQSALEYGYEVSIPPYWDRSIKDVNDAVIKYGRFPTLLSIIQHATTSAAKIKIYKDKIL